ncbi:MAG: RES family NAD+ phosphorylase [Longimicrobiales bacterium]
MPDRAPVQTLWRAYVPRWAHQPLSGHGAAVFGGRWNAVGRPTIYAARELSTAWAEYNQGLVQHPATIIQLELEGAALANLTDDEQLARLQLDREIHFCDWRADLDRGKTPATHRLSRKLLNRGFDGVIYPSHMSPGGTCAALWRWHASRLPRLSVIDPEGRLPRTAASWVSE